MGTRNELDHDTTVLDPLHGLVAGVHAELLSDGLLDGDLTPLSDSTRQVQTLLRNTY